MAISFSLGSSELGGSESTIAVRPQSAAPAVERSDASLISAIRAGDRSAFADLYDRYVDALMSLAQRIFGQRTGAEDLVHDVFIAAWQTAASYEAERGSVRTWLLLRTRCRALDRVRSGVTRDQLRLATRVLSDEERALLTQIYGFGMPLCEVAQQLNVPLGDRKST